MTCCVPLNEVNSQLVADVGFDPVDAGGLRVCRYTEPFAMLTAELAYGTDQGPNWAYRFGRIDGLFRLQTRAMTGPTRLGFIGLPQARVAPEIQHRKEQRALRCL